MKSPFTLTRTIQAIQTARFRGESISAAWGCIRYMLYSPQSIACRQAVVRESRDSAQGGGDPWLTAVLSIDLHVFLERDRKNNSVPMRVNITYSGPKVRGKEDGVK